MTKTLPKTPVPPCPAIGWRDTAVVAPNRCARCGGWGAIIHTTNVGVSRETCPRCLGKGHS